MGRKWNSVAQPSIKPMHLRLLFLFSFFLSQMGRGVEGGGQLFKPINVIFCSGRKVISFSLQRSMRYRVAGARKPILWHFGP